LIYVAGLGLVAGGRGYNCAGRDEVGVETLSTAVHLRVEVAHALSVVAHVRVARVHLQHRTVCSATCRPTHVMNAELEYASRIHHHLPSQSTTSSAFIYI